MTKLFYIISVSVTLVVCISIILNLLLPAVMTTFASAKQIKPPNGAANLGFFDQVMHMLVHHNQVPLASSIVVALIVLLSVVGSYYLTKRFNKSLVSY